MVIDNKLLANEHARKVYQYLRENKKKFFKVSNIAFACGLSETQTRFTLQKLVHWYPSKIYCNNDRPLKFAWFDKPPSF